MEMAPEQTPPSSPQKRQLRELLRYGCMAVIAIGCGIMFLRDVLADIPYARTGVALLTAAALVGFYLSEKKA